MLRKIYFSIVTLLLSGTSLIAQNTGGAIKEHLKDKPAITYLNDTVRLQYVENTGAALSLGDDLPKAASFWLLSILPLIILLVLFVYTLKHLQQMGTMKIFSIAH